MTTRRTFMAGLLASAAAPALPPIGDGISLTSMAHPERWTHVRYGLGFAITPDTDLCEASLVRAADALNEMAKAAHDAMSARYTRLAFGTMVTKTGADGTTSFPGLNEVFNQ